MDKEEYEEYLELLDRIPNMNDDELKEELSYYLITIKVLKKRLKNQTIYFQAIRWFLFIKAIPEKYVKSARICAEEFSYEYLYLNAFEYIIKRMLKNKKYEDTKLIYICLCKLNQIGNYRDFYLKDLIECSYGNDKEELHEKINFDYSDISYSANKLLKKLGSKK